MIKRLPVAGMALAVALLITPAAQAMKLKSQNLTQLISASQSIISGTVSSVSDGIDANGVPYTQVTIQIGSAAKGNHKAGSEYSFRQFGLLKPRTNANGHKLVAVTPEGFSRWFEGETVVAFMYKPASRTGLQTTAGMAQGKLGLANGKLINDFNNAGMFDGVQINNALLSPEQQSMLTAPGAVDAGAFMDLVGRAVEERWIENGEMK
jgi:hypothetical protein